LGGGGGGGEGRGVTRAECGAIVGITLVLLDVAVKKSKPRAPGARKER
jgi:hypothetical protein